MKGIPKIRKPSRPLRRSGQRGGGMTKNERRLINAALRWLAADLTPCKGNEDNWGEGAPKDELEDAIADVANERGRTLESYFDVDAIRAGRATLRTRTP